MTHPSRLTKEPWPPSRDEQLRRLAERKALPHEIADCLACTVETVRQRAWHLGVRLSAGGARS